MAKKLLITLVAIMGLSILALAANKPNFSGTWNLDQGRSYGIPANMKQILTITHTGDTMEIETKIIQPNNERTIKDTFTIDGKEYEFQPPSPPNAQTPPPKGKRTVTWLPGDIGLMVTDITKVQTPQGEGTAQNVRKWVINAQGELVVDVYMDTPNGSFEAKRIFQKQ